MSRHTLRFRQVHLDFHTSGDITGIGARFDKKQFQDCLLEAKVDSITCFSKCHHGWSYHDTKVGRKHPHLKDELLQRQIEACREIGVRVPIYLSAGIDELMAAEHPEWLMMNRQGVVYDPLKPHWFRLMRWNSPYLDYLCQQIEEVTERWRDADGIFLDIISPRTDYTDQSLQEIIAAGFNPENEAEVSVWADQSLLNYYERTNASCRKYRDDMPVFHNAGHIAIGSQRYWDHNSHLELESLPTGGWGYDHFPLSARFAITTKHDFLGMTGKFHTTWGEFGGFKRSTALRYECDAMIAYGAKCSIGDQLHPSGEMNRDTYHIIGEAYRDVAAKEAWCEGVTPVAQIAVISAVKNQGETSGVHGCHLADEGAARMLLECHQPFVVLDRFASWDGFDLIILPDSVKLDAELKARAEAHIARGGKILASGSSLFDAENKQFVIDAGARLLGHGTLNPDYLVATDLCPEISVRSPIVIHGCAWNVEPAGAAVFAARADTHFNRTWKHLCSHQHAPDAGPSPYPGATVTESVAYFAHDIFTRYRHYGQPLYRDFVLAAIRHLLGEKLIVETSLPTTGRVNLMHQADQHRYVMHLLHAVPSLRGGGQGEHALPIEVIEDITPLFDVACSVRLPREISAARLVPGGHELALKRVGGVLEFTVPRLDGHQMVEFAYA